MNTVTAVSGRRCTSAGPIVSRFVCTRGTTSSSDGCAQGAVVEGVRICHRQGDRGRECGGVLDIVGAADKVGQGLGRGNCEWYVRGGHGDPQALAGLDLYRGRPDAQLQWLRLSRGERALGGLREGVIRLNDAAGVVGP